MATQSKTLYSCMFCSYTSYSRTSITGHTRHMHLKDRKRDSEEAEGKEENCQEYMGTFTKPIVRLEPAKEFFEDVEGYPDFVRCLDCKSFVKKTHRSEHIKFHKSVSVYECYECDRWFNSPQKVSDHYKYEHRKELPSSINNMVRPNIEPAIQTFIPVVMDHDNVICTKCDQIISDNKKVFHHYSCHHGFKKFICSLCPHEEPTYGKIKGHYMGSHSIFLPDDIMGTLDVTNEEGGGKKGRITYFLDILAWLNQHLQMQLNRQEIEKDVFKKPYEVGPVTKPKLEEAAASSTGFTSVPDEGPRLNPPAQAGNPQKLKMPSFTAGLILIPKNNGLQQVETEKKVEPTDLPQEKEVVVINSGAAISPGKERPSIVSIVEAFVNKNMNVTSQSPDLQKTRELSVNLSASVQLIKMAKN